MSNKKIESKPASSESIIFARGAIIGLLSNFDSEAAQAAFLVLKPGEPTQEDITNALDKIDKVNKRISARKQS